MDNIRILLDTYGDAAVDLDTKIRKLHAEGRTSDALIAIAQTIEGIVRPLADAYARRHAVLLEIANWPDDDVAATAMRRRANEELGFG